MMNDPDEAMKLTALGPAGGIVSLHELPDFVRFVLAEDARPEIPHPSRASPFLMSHNRTILQPPKDWENDETYRNSSCSC